MGEHYVESLNSRAREELLNREDFGSLLEAHVVVEASRIEYNTYRPHGALNGLSSCEVRATPNTNQHSHERWTNQTGSRQLQR